MLEFRWALPSPTTLPSTTTSSSVTPLPSAKREVVLKVLSRHGWFGRKVLSVDGKCIYNRWRFDGIDHDFYESNKPLCLRLVRKSGSNGWFPQLTMAGSVLPEVTGTAAPRAVQVPPAIGLVTGFVYLMMLLTIVVLPPIVKILYALHGDGKRYAILNYTATQDILPWVVPFMGTAVCLVGFWDMHRWGVWTLGLLIAAEVVANLTVGIPVTWVGLVLQGVLLCLGLAYYKKME